MADQKITQLTENTTPADGDLVAIVDDPSGTPSTQKATLRNIIQKVGGGSVVDTDIAGGSATSSSTYADITGADVSITTTVTSHILLMATVQAYGNVDLAPYTIQWHDGTSNIGASSRVYLRSSNPRTTVAIHHIVVDVAAGTHTYTLQHKSEDNSSSLTAETFSLNCISIPTGA